MNHEGGPAWNCGSVETGEGMTDSEPDTLACWGGMAATAGRAVSRGKGGPMQEQRAPALSVISVGAPVGLDDLTARGAALLVFVSEECPTSAMALRNLGPLCRGWESGGLTAAAVFEDPLDVALRVARRLGWTGRVLSQPPPYQASRAYGLLSVPTAVLVGRGQAVEGTVVGWDQPGLAGLIRQAGQMLGAGHAASAAAAVVLAQPPVIEPLLKPGCSSKAALDPAVAAAISRPAAEDELEE